MTSETIRPEPVMIQVQRLLKQLRGHEDRSKDFRLIGTKTLRELCLAIEKEGLLNTAIDLRAEVLLELRRVEATIPTITGPQQASLNPTLNAHLVKCETLRQQRNELNELINFHRRIEDVLARRTQPSPA